MSSVMKAYNITIVAIKWNILSYLGTKVADRASRNAPRKVPQATTSMPLSATRVKSDVS